MVSFTELSLTQLVLGKASLDELSMIELLSDVLSLEELSLGEVSFFKAFCSSSARGSDSLLTHRRKPYVN